MKINYESGQLIGNCKYVKDVEVNKQSTKYRRYALFICECGNEFVSQIDSVKRGSTKSCGCLADTIRKINGRKRKTHGMSKTAVYQKWSNMKLRCYDKSNPSYEKYGARGITVCDRWLESFENFYEDLGKYHSENLELDRIDVNGNYCPENCRWATEQVQSWNKRIYGNNSTGSAGVTVSSRNSNKFEVRISKDGVEFHIGTFNSLEDAIESRKKAEVDLYGEELVYKRIRSEIDV